MRNVLVVAALLLVVLPAQAQDTPGPPVVVTEQPDESSPILFIGGSLGISSYAMSDVNDLIGDVNVAAGSEILSDIHGGPSYGLELGLQLNRSFSFGLFGDRLAASTEGGGLTFDIPGNVVGAFVDFTPFPELKPRVVAGAGLGYLWVDGTIAVTEEIAPTPREVSATGSSVYVEGYTYGDIPLGGTFSFVPLIGVRWANVTSVEFSPDADIPDFRINYNGVFAQIALRFYFGSRKTEAEKAAEAD